MEFSVGRTGIRIEPVFAALLTLMLIADTSGVCALSLFACIVHETGHLLCLLALGGHPEKVRLSFYGMSIERKNELCISHKGELAIALSGPAVNLVLAVPILIVSELFYAPLRIVGLCQLCVGLFNLLPVVPLDCGRAIFIAVSMKNGELTALHTVRILSAVTLIPLAAASVAVFFFGNFNLTLLLVTGYIAFLYISDKK